MAILFLLLLGVAGASPLAASGNPSDLERARAFLEEGQLEQAARLLSATVRQPASRGESLVLLCQLASARGEHEQAVEYGKQAVEALPASAEAHYRYAVALRNLMTRVGKLKAMGMLGSYKTALARAIELDPQHLDARAEEIGFLISAPGIAGGSKEKGKARIEELLRLDPRRGTTMKAMLLRSEGESESAITLLRDYLGRYPDDHDNRLLLAMTLQDAKRFRQADAELEPLLAVEGGTTALSAAYQLARSRVLGSYDQQRAVALLTDYLQRRPETSRGLPSRAAAYWRLGQAYQQLGEIARAREAFQQALALEPDNEEAAKALKSLPKS